MKDKKTMFENTLEELGLEYKVIKPHTPKQNGRVEEVIEKIKKDFTIKRVFYGLRRFKKSKEKNGEKNIIIFL
ncbi:MAG: hypothetical protein ACLRTR_00855 [Clostridia bacterium]